MSVVAHTNIGQKHLASVQLNSEPAVAEISVSARIDYIQRFSKHAVLVIDDEVSVCDQAARQFLSNISSDTSKQETNVAFVSASTKLNDIQLRCRLIEQLFANTLFDPEKSLAVSILNLSKHSKDNIHIIVEHAHALSLQIKYELCQLVDIANKTHNKINVVLFGLEQAATEVAVNKTIFKNKLSIVDAKSGQLLPLDHAKFTTHNALHTPMFWTRLIVIAILAFSIIGLSWYGLVQYDVFRLSQLSANSISSSDNLLKSDLTLLSKKDNEIINGKSFEADEFKVEEPGNELAKASDIQAALLGETLFVPNVESTPAQAADVLQALALVETNIQTESSKVPNELFDKKELIIEKIPQQATQKTTVEASGPILPIVLTPNYYLNASAGYVVQIVGFTDLTLLKRFMKTHPNLPYFSYQKKLLDQTFIVLTTKIFASQQQAREAIKALPQTIIDSGVWVKPVSTVKAEINNT